MIVKLEIFSLNKTGSCRIKNLKVNDVPRTVVTIRNKKFKVISGIFHHGTTVNSGYHDNMIRQGKDWIKIINKSVKKSPWPRSSKDVYILFLERV